MPLLLTVLRGDPLTPHPDWPLALALAEHEHLLPWFLHRARAYETSLPPTFAAAQRQCQIDTFLYTSALTGLLKSLAAAAIPVLLLKGPSLAERLYGNAAFRPARDLDLLVRQEHFAASQSLLRSQGFTPNDLPDDYHQSLSRQTLTVELHYDVENPLTFDFDIASAWASAQPTVFRGQPAFVFAPAHELLYLCVHATRHRFERLSYLLDIAQALKDDPPALKSALPNVLALGTEMAHKLIPQSVPASAALPHIQALAETLWQQVLTNPATPADWQAMHNFYLALEPTTASRFSRRLRDLRILTTRLTEPDRVFSARLGLPYKWAAHLLRPLRLLLARLN